jgi:hypothetical protein
MLERHRGTLIEGLDRQGAHRRAENALSAMTQTSPAAAVTVLFANSTIVPAKWGRNEIENKEPNNDQAKHER